jgi:cytochrome c oxidase assembly factor CtaG
MTELLPPMLLGAVAAWYLANARRPPAPLPGWRVACFLGGVMAILVALGPPIDGRAGASLTAHMVQHLLLTSVAAPLVVLGRPVTLLLKTTSTRSAARRVVRSRTFGALTHPVVAWVAFVGAMYAAHLGPLYEAALRSPAWHAAEHSLFLATALLFWLPVAGETPAPTRLGHGARLLYLALAMPAEGFLALAIFSAEDVMYPAYAGAGALGDQRSAAALLWIVGDLVFLGALVLAALAWKEDEEARQRRLEEGSHGLRPTPAPE